MKVILERVSQASVSVEDQVVGEIEHGYLLLIGLTHTDNDEIVGKMAQKIANLRIMADEQDKLNKTLTDVEGKILAVPQFTLYADTSGRRPGFREAASPDQARTLFESFVAQLLAQGLFVEKGIFGAHMIVESKNDGPLTLILES